MEEWRDIPGYEGLYQVSNLGRVKSLARSIVRGNGYKQTFKERILRPGPTNGYFTVCINRKSEYVHRLVAITFVPNPNNLREVNHINSDRSDSRVENLEWVSTRDNALHARIRKRNTSIYPGVSWNGKNKRWGTFIKLNGKEKALGMFKNEEDAHQAYLTALSENGIEVKYSKVA